MRYEGKELCAGCKKTSQESPRTRKNDLCWVCEEALEYGRAKKHEDGIEYQRVRQHYHAYRSNELNKLLHDLLKSLHNPSAKAGGYEEVKHYFGDNVGWYTIPSHTFKVVVEFMQRLEDKMKDITEQYEGIEPAAKIAVSNEKNRIYNEGVQKGRELLMSLNNGEISMSDFSKSINKY